jgi:hypothetical protein
MSDAIFITVVVAVSFLSGWWLRGKAIIKYIQHLQGQIHNGK